MVNVEAQVYLRLFFLPSTPVGLPSVTPVLKLMDSPDSEPDAQIRPYPKAPKCDALFIRDEAHRIFYGVSAL